MQVDTEVVIRQPPDRVFAFLADPKNMPRWLPACTGARIAGHGPLGAGARIEFDRANKGAGAYNVTAFEPGRRIAMADAENPQYGLTYLLEAVPNGTLVTCRFSAEAPQGFSALLLRLAVLGPVKVVMVQALRTLAAALDGPGASTRVASRTSSGGASSPAAPPAGGAAAAAGERFATLALVAANLVPLVGVLAFGWDTGSIVLLYWCENIVAGFYTALRMATAEAPVVAKLAMIPFFTFHYGMFCSVHGSFVVAIFHLEQVLHIKGFATPPELFRAAASLPGMALPLLALFVSHGVSFIENHFVRGERHTADLGMLMMRPYGRMIVLHVAIIFGGFAAQAAGSPAALLVILVLLKLGVDVGTHRRFVAKGAAPGPVAAVAGTR